MEKKMNNYGMKNEKKINNDTLGESLLICVANAREYCESIDEEVHHLARIAFIPYVSAIEQYERILSKIYLKSDIIHLYKTFMKWFKNLKLKHKKIVKRYFFDGRKSRCICKACNEVTTANYRKDRVIIPVVRSFMQYLEESDEINIEDLLEHPFISKIYKRTLNRNSRHKRCGFGARKGAVSA